jgi:hypothetical protein
MLLFFFDGNDFNNWKQFHLSTLVPVEIIADLFLAFGRADYVIGDVKVSFQILFAVNSRVLKRT